ncbi:MAG: hypothetical protein ACRDJP_15580 [Actinomycetota bacterium]
MRRIVAIMVAAGVMAAAIGVAAAKPSPPTKIRFKLDDHHVAEGETVTGTIVALTGRGKHREPLAGATMRLLVDKVEVATLETDDQGRAVVEHVAAETGEHTMKLVYAGDGEHRRAKRAQGFEVGGEEDLDQLEE